MWEFAMVFLFLSGGCLSILGELIPFKCFGNGGIWGGCIKSYEVRAGLKAGQGLGRKLQAPWSKFFGYF